MNSEDDMETASRDEIIACMNEMAPESLAETWDNCGLMVGGERGRDGRVRRVLVCLDVTEAVADEAIRVGADLVVSHHPLVFKPLRSIVCGEGSGTAIHKLIKADVDVYSAHTNVDKTPGGLNDLVAGIVGLKLMDDGRAGDCDAAGAAPQPQAPPQPPQPPQPYRIGDLPCVFSPDELFAHICSRLKQDDIAVVRPPQAARGKEPSIRRLAVMCGSYGIDAPVLVAAKADAVLCGEIKHHSAIELAQLGIYVAAVGHHGSERFFMALAEKWLKDRFPSLDVVCAGFDSHPFQVYHYGRGH